MPRRTTGTEPLPLFDPILRDLALPNPRTLGLTHYREWRPFQADAAWRVAGEASRFTMLAAPTGMGKSLIYIAAAVLSGKRVCILTSTKGLQAQLMRDFATIGLTNVEGANNYPCRLVKEEMGTTVGCDEGPCHGGVSCAYKSAGCSYYDAIAHAKDAKLVVTNYAFYLHAQAYMKTRGEADGIGPFDMLVCDEAHDAPDSLSDFLSFTFDHEPIRKYLDATIPETEAAEDQWAGWASFHLPRVNSAVEALKAQLQEDGWLSTRARLLAAYQGLERGLTRLRELTKHHHPWVVERTKTGVKWTPLWPAPYAERYLFRDTPRVVFVSATVRRQTAVYLGVAPAALEVAEYPAVFPVRNRRVYHLPTVQMNYRTEANPLTERLWVNQCGHIFRSRKDRKGVVHTTSYKRADALARGSKANERIIFPRNAGHTRQLIEHFKEADPADGAIFVSPSVTTGYDFPLDECEYQIILKIPFPDSRSAVVKARLDADKEYGPYHAMQTLVQMVGRGCRTPTDVCETFVLDDSIRWFLPKFRHLAPTWFLESVTWLSTIPAAPPALRNRTATR